MRLLILTIILVSCSLIACADTMETFPLVFPNQMPPAANLLCNLLEEEDAWRAGALDFLNNSTNLSLQAA